MSVLYCILITIISASTAISATLTHNMDKTVSRVCKLTYMRLEPLIVKLYDAVQYRFINVVYAVV